MKKYFLLSILIMFLACEKNDKVNYYNESDLNGLYICLNDFSYYTFIDEYLLVCSQDSSYTNTFGYYMYQNKIIIDYFDSVVNYKIIILNDSQLKIKSNNIIYCFKRIKSNIPRPDKYIGSDTVKDYFHPTIPPTIEYDNSLNHWGE